MLINRHIFPAFQPKLKPFAHQERIFEDTKGKKYYALFMEQGTGKSKIIVDNIIWLFLKQEIDGVLITTDKAFYLNWFYEEIPKHMPDWMKYRMAYWDADMNKTEWHRLTKLLKPEDDVLDIFITNVESFATDRGFEIAMQFAKIHYTYMVVDESTCIKSHVAKRTKGVTRVGRVCDYRRILTGTPLTKGPLDIYAQAEFLEHGLSGHPSFLSFKNHYAEFRRIEFGNRSYEKITGYKNLSELTALISTFSTRILKSECLDLPDKVFEKIMVHHTSEQARYYKALKEEALIEFKDDTTVSSTSVLTTLMKLHQINCGHVVNDDGETVRLDNNRIPALMSTLEVMEGKIIIWCYFKEDVRMIVEALTKEYGEGSAVHYYGDTTITERTLHLERFKRDPACRFFVSNETGSKSLTLVQSNQSIYYSYGYKLETWLQSQDRNHRIGQDKTVVYKSFMIPKTVDQSILEALMNKHEIANNVLDTWRILI